VEQVFAFMDMINNYYQKNHQLCRNLLYFKQTIIMNDSQEIRKQIEQKIIEKAMKDEDFRKQLIDDPKHLLEQEFRMKLPDSVDIIVVEEDAQTFYLVLPQNSAIIEDGELTEADLELVSGGYGRDTNESSCHVELCIS